jgi:hypothetical protein
MDSCYARPLHAHLYTNTPHHPHHVRAISILTMLYCVLTHTPKAYHGFSPCPAHACALCFIPGEKTSVLILVSSRSCLDALFIPCCLLSILGPLLIYSATSHPPSLPSLLHTYDLKMMPITLCDLSDVL